jgi:hypothetical protein
MHMIEIKGWILNFEIAKTITMIAMTKTKINGKPVIYNDLLFCQL